MVKKAIFHKTWLEKHPKLAKTNCIGRWVCLGKTNCIGRWICLAILEEKLQWTSLNLSDLSSAKMIHLETSSRILLICITSQLTRKFRRQSKQRQERRKEKILERSSLFAFLQAKRNAEITLFTVHFKLHATKTCFLLRKLDSVFWAQNRHFRLRPRRENIYLPKTKWAALKGHPLIVATIVS